MGKRNSFMTGALAAMVGMAIGASFSGSETTAFGAADPNRGQTGFRPVAQEQTVQTRRAVLRDRYANRKVPSFQTEAGHAAAGEEAVEADTSHCEGLTGGKLNRCVIQSVEQSR